METPNRKEVAEMTPYLHENRKIREHLNALRNVIFI
jgi:hypothetical protein